MFAATVPVAERIVLAMSRFIGHPCGMDIKAHPAALLARRRGLVRSWGLLVLAIIFIPALSAGLMAAGRPIVPFSNGVNLSAHLEYIEDSERKFAVGDILRMGDSWKETPGGSVNFGYSRSAYWFRARIANSGQTAASALLEIDFPSLDLVEVYSPDGAGGLKAVRTGDRLRFDSRPIRDPNLLFPLILEPGANTIYIRALNSGSLRFSARLFSEQGYIERKNGVLPALWLLYGMLALIAGFNFFVYALLRERMYLYFALFSAILLLYQMSHRGYAFQFLWPDSPEWANTALPVFMNLLGAFSALFIRSAMATDLASPRFNLFFRLFGYALFPLSAALAFVLPTRLSLLATYTLLFVIAAAVVIYVLTALAKGSRFVRYFGAGIGGIAVFTVMGILTALGRLPLNFFTEWSTELGFLCLVLTASIGMIDRMKTLTDQLKGAKEEQGNSIVQLTAANQELAATNEELNAAMEELSATNEEFEAQNEELIAAENELRRSEEKYRSLVENINEAIYSAGSEGKLTYISPAIEKIAGFTAEEITRLNFISLIHPDDVARIAGRFERLARGEIEPSEYRIKTKTGEYRWVSTISQPLFQKGVFSGANGVLTDIHERREAEERILQEKNFAATIIDTLPGIFFLLDGGGKLVRWKGRIKGDDAFGYSPDEVRAMNPLDMVDPRDRELAAAKLLEGFEAGQAAAEINFRRKNDEHLAFYVAVSRMRLDGENYLIGIGFEITDRKRAEEEREKTRMQLIQAQKMEAIGTLAGGIAHDFNNMLMGIMGSLDLIKLILKKEGTVDRSAILNYIEIALESSKRSADMTRRLLTLSRKSGLQTVPMDVNDTIADVHRLCVNTLPKSVKLEFRPSTEPLRVRAEPVQIEQVLLNLCVNAAHAMTTMRAAGEREGGVLKVSASVARYPETPHAGHAVAAPGTTYVTLEVEDTGVGITDEIREQIFDPFFTTKRKEEGTGLGLAIAYTIVQQHGGFIDIASRPGAGSTFKVYLPALEEEEVSIGSVPEENELVAGEGRILLVDDEKPVLGIAAGMLEEMGYQVSSAESAYEALEIFKQAPGGFAAVVLDLSMPGVSGLELFEKLRAIDPGVRVLLASGLIDGSVLADALDRGIAGFLQKPYSITELSIGVKKAISAESGQGRSN
ncbi:MAG: Blue-light-activated protein [Spirochaetes bacterium ADurb.BinA120]|nr:MAG: Blue-light-activated protein [Spirochaetes bacterium ADurb.BinA120]